MKKLLQIILIGTFVFFSGCGSRKASKLETKENTEVNIHEQSEKAENTEKAEKLEELKQNEIVCENDISQVELDLEPIDPNKPMVKTEKTEGNTVTTAWQNAKVREKHTNEKSKKTDHSVISKKSDVSEKSEKSEKAGLEIKAEGGKKTITKESDAQRGFSFWWLFLLLIPAVIIYYFIKK